jgi:ABC-type uncharacterized transport system substrate-binding protein
MIKGRSAHTRYIIHLGLLLVLTVCTASGSNPARVLLLHSFGRDFAPFDTFGDTFRTALAQQMAGAVVFYDVDVESARLEAGQLEGHFTRYLLSLFANEHLDLIVPIGGPAARFAQARRSYLFPDSPLLFAATDQRHLNLAAFATNDTAVCVSNSPAVAVSNILKVLPATTNIAVVIGNSPLEKFWLEELRRDLQPFNNRVHFSWFNTLSFPQIRQRVSTLPPGSAIFYAIMLVDAEGVPHSGQRALTSLHNVANAPMFGLHDTQMGYGIVGGPLSAIDELGRKTAAVASRILRGEPAGNIRTITQVAGSPIYDWRQLQRWGIAERNLPSGSAVWFRQRTVWDLYKWRILLAIATAGAGIGAVYYRRVVRLQAARRAQNAFTHALILSQENQRKHIAGELHDGLAQNPLLITNRLGLLAADAQHPPELARVERTFQDCSAHHCRCSVHFPSPPPGCFGAGGFDQGYRVDG